MDSSKHLEEAKQDGEEFLHIVKLTQKMKFLNKELKDIVKDLAEERYGDYDYDCGCDYYCDCGCDYY